MEDNLLRLQNVQIEILKVIDTVCTANHIPYSLYAGTLLGAVRHHGFIPWDDDLDICMTRENYQRFIAAWESNHPVGYLLQNKENTPAFTQSFTKIRKEHTTFLQAEWERGRYHTGIFVDVFPIDRMPRNAAARAIFEWECLKYLLLTREFIPPKENALVKAVSAMVLNSCPPKNRMRVREQLLHAITKVCDPCACTVAIETRKTANTPLPPDLMDAYTRMTFGDATFPCMAGWRSYLEIKYGDYMTLPPEAERTWKHRPIVLDFERDLKEIEYE